MGNKNLQKAKNAKNDEFYTLWEDIEKELKNYPAECFFKKKVVSPCGEPCHSNFVRWHYYNFLKLGLSKYTSTGYEGNLTRSAQCYFLKDAGDAVEELIFPQAGIISKKALEFPARGFSYEMTFDNWRADEMTEKIVISPDGLAKLKKKAMKQQN